MHRPVCHSFKLISSYIVAWLSQQGFLLYVFYPVLSHTWELRIGVRQL